MTLLYTAYLVASVLSIPFFAWAIYRTGEVDRTLSILFAFLLCMAWPLAALVGVCEVGTYLWKRVAR